MRRYEADDLKTLSSGEAMRTKVGMYLSANLQEAINLGLRELIVNAQDEYEVYKPRNAHIKIVLNTQEKTISVEDNLRGIPVGVREDGINSLEAAFLLPHSGAKHKEGVYSSAIGTNGIGNKIVCHTAEWLNAIVTREGKQYKIGFKSDDKGAYISEPIKEVPWDKNESGTYIQYKPDSRVYGNIFIDVEKLEETLEEMSLFTKELRITLNVDGEVKTFYSKYGLVDGLKNELAISKPFSYFYDDPSCQVELALQWVQKGGEVKGYANGLYMPDGGAFMTSFKTALTRQFNILSENKFEGAKIRNCLDGFCSVKVKVGQFTNQQKTALANPETREPVSKAVGECLREFVEKNEEVFNSIVTMLGKIEKAELAAERARVAVMESTKEIERTSRKKVFASDKLKDASKLGKDSILLLVEGKSAAASMINARDHEKYGVLALRGKVINALSNEEEKIYNNEEVKIFLSAMGINPNNYKSNKLRYGQAAICVDSDSDGFHISLLIISLIHKLAPQFLKEGRLLWLRAPLFRVSNNRGKYYYYSNEELSKGAKGIQTRFKGLGELSTEDTKISMFSKEYQRLDPIQYSDDGIKRLEELMGKEVTYRKDFVLNQIDFSELER